MGINPVFRWIVPSLSATDLANESVEDEFGYIITR